MNDLHISDYRNSLQEEYKRLLHEGEYLKVEFVGYLTNFIPCKESDKNNLRLSTDDIIELLKPCIEFEKEFVADLMLSVGYIFSLGGNNRVAWNIKRLDIPINLGSVCNE